MTSGKINFERSRLNAFSDAGDLMLLEAIDYRICRAIGLTLCCRNCEDLVNDDDASLNLY